MKTINDIQSTLDELQEDLEMLTQREVLKYFMDIGNKYQQLEKEQLQEQHIVKGCMSPVYILAEEKEGAIWYRGYADALTVRGYMVFLLELCNGLSPDDIINHIEPILTDFLKTTQIHANLVPSRANSFGNIFKKMKNL